MIHYTRGAIAVGEGLAQAAGADPDTLSLWFDLGGATGIMPNETGHDILLGSFIGVALGVGAQICGGVSYRPYPYWPG
jgi:hypothetical protein